MNNLTSLDLSNNDIGNEPLTLCPPRAIRVPINLLGVAVETPLASRSKRLQCRLGNKALGRPGGQDGCAEEGRKRNTHPGPDQYVSKKKGTGLGRPERDCNVGLIGYR